MYGVLCLRGCVAAAWFLVCQFAVVVSLPGLLPSPPIYVTSHHLKKNQKYLDEANKRLRHQVFSAEKLCGAVYAVHMASMRRLGNALWRLKTHAEPRLAFAEYFVCFRILRHYKVIALALGAPGAGRPTGGPEMLARVGTTRS